MSNLKQIECPKCKTRQLHNFDIMEGLPSHLDYRECPECEHYFESQKNVVEEADK